MLARCLITGTLIRTYKGLDGTPVVEIETDALPEDSKGPRLRIYLNDNCLYENPTFKENNAS